MGLGLFLTRSVIERLGGNLRLESAVRQGVTAIVDLPRLPLPAQRGGARGGASSN
jgi:signal transduction histidine kinase